MFNQEDRGLSWRVWHQPLRWFHSAGFACEFADVARYRFYEECAKYKIPVTNYEPGELEAELKALRSL